jgi:polynucleotide 5'-hydroxyl-kinase GRC3/NOL9
MPLQISLEWQEHLAELSAFRGSIMVLGAPDTGKTSFCTALMNIWSEAGRRTALIDCDLGQSEIGPPGTVGLAYATEPVDGPSRLAHSRIEFVGTTSPQRNAAQALAAICLLFRSVTEAHSTLIDTCGHVFGPSARLYKTAKLRLVWPDLVVALQSESELEPLLALFESLEGPEVRRVPASAHSVLRTPAARTRRREAKWARYFREAPEHVVPFESVGVYGCRWLSCPPVSEADLRRIAGVLGGKPLAAERAPGALTILTEGHPGDAAVVALQEEFAVRHINLIHPRAFQNLLCGVAEQHGRTIAAGIVLGIDFEREEIRLLTPVRSTRSIRVLHFGMHRVAPDGRDLGPIQPWQV